MTLIELNSLAEFMKNCKHSFNYHYNNKKYKFCNIHSHENFYDIEVRIYNKLTETYDFYTFIYIEKTNILGTYNQNKYCKESINALKAFADFAK